MMKTWKQNMEETKQHYVDWWNHKGVVVNMWEHFQQGVKPHADVPMPNEPKDLNQKWFDAKWRADYLDWYVAHSSLKADMLPVANTQLGPGSLAAILGGVFEGGEDTIWIHPNPNFTDEITFDENNANWLLHKELLKACKAKAQGNYYVGMPDLMEGMDVLAALKGTDKVLLDTVMQPEVLERQMQQINDIYFRVFDELYDIIREGDEMAFCYFSAWAPGKMTKLQCDISTMINEDDYRRFALPFLREQCQKIDYTLYHFDGVGAQHHLPALLEIKELNAIQWTPGVGEPQGGSPKWYDLYRRILNAGKSIMACWVTLDELRPLLENIGTDGVHLEMDFHNEEEVEQALEIVEQCKQTQRSVGVQESPSGVQEFRSSGVQTIASESSNSSTRQLVNSSTESTNSSTCQLVNSSTDQQVIQIIESIENEDNMSNNPSTLISPIQTIAQQRVLVLDGAMGTMIQRYNLAEADFRGDRFANHGCELRGCNDLLCITRPDVVSEIHRKYLEAGADIIETNTFNAQRISMADFRLETECREINLAAVKLARTLADEYTKKNPQKPRFVAGSVGPTSKTCSIMTDNTQPGWNTFGYGKLLEAYKEQMEALLEGGVDVLLIETIFDTLNAKAAIEAANAAMTKTGKQVPLMLSFNVTGSEGRNMLGQSIEEFISTLDKKNIFSVGVNCIGDVAQITPLIDRLGAIDGLSISLYPNAGQPDINGNYSQTPEMMQRAVWPMLEWHRLNIIGGCCGTTNEHIAAISRLLQPVDGFMLSPHKSGVAAPVIGVQELPSGVKECRSVGVQTLASESSNSSTRQLVNSSTESTNSSTEGVNSSTDNSLFDAIVGGKANEAVTATKAAVEQGIAPQDIINGQMVKAMAEVGQRFEEGKAFVPQLLMAGRAMKAGLEILKPLMAGDTSTSIGKIIIGTVKGDLHDIGKNLVASMLEGCGFEVINIGIDVTSEQFVDAIKQHNADILCMSALLTTTMTYMPEVLQALEAAGIRDKVKVMIGGAPITQAFADEIGADGYSDNANSAVALAKRLMGV
ncbi:MAG: homocysteine S-methyltransferase family protein [Prevotella sp.]|nr:homocysteine S-methyltransferase family protein [Prevotella sp.]